MRLKEFILSTGVHYFAFEFVDFFDLFQLQLVFLLVQFLQYSRILRRIRSQNKSRNVLPEAEFVLRTRSVGNILLVAKIRHITYIEV